MAALVVAALLSLLGSVCLAQVKAPAPGADRHGAVGQMSQLVSASPPDFNSFQFVPKVADFTKLNRRAKVSFVVNDDGSVSAVKILKGTGSSQVDAGLVKGIQAWKYKPQPGCKLEMSGEVVIDIGRE